MKHPRTTILGILTALALLLPPVIQGLQTGHWDWQAIAKIASGLAAGGVGIAAADGRNVSNGVGDQSKTNFNS